ncbi:CPA2 family monovalent cation:H+ antiporter-2/glutathione-regulated potassium-efflux system protein KefB [Amaricoccus macauensis]|uniref:CPA2 family monovalent cation:H+ antiporter-2/glutathione-regulated potassium-efflux system protein KefB n=1 Tax=Amaricoccus macauensis TaxID=57001 RepID=A0A840SLW3_9RHOB|nr:CPA2 family monovalent cation:H+ antiporter-2/glutathione-regulated potassium-efflux system protein KefB [Amaricoccus macauensis]
MLFLFIIGLEMRPSRLWSMRGEIFGLGLAQVGLCMLMLWTVGITLGYPLATALISGTGFVLTSTAIVMQVLDERGELNLAPGRRIIAILLLEDLAIVPLLALVAFLAPGGGEAVTLAERIQSVVIGLAAIAALIAAGRWLLDPLFRVLANARAREVMTAAALLIVLGSALLMQSAGLSMAMGAFLAGVMLSESTYRHQLEADVEPFRGILLGLFFLSVGMSLDLAVVWKNLWLILASVVAFMILKGLGIYLVARVARASRAEALQRAVLMIQSGEFAFVLYAAAVGVGLLTPEENANLTAIIILSMALTPLLVMLHDRFATRQTVVSAEGLDVPDGLEGSALIIGFGRVGQIVSQPLLGRDCSISMIETDPEMIQAAAEFGFKVHYGDGTRLDILRAAGAAEAGVIVVCVEEPETQLRIVELVKAEFPMVPVLSRAYDRQSALALEAAGVDFEVRDTFEAALALGEKAILTLGADPARVPEIMQDVRERDAERFERQLVGGITAARDLIRGNIPGWPGNRRTDDEARRAMGEPAP